MDDYKQNIKMLAAGENGLVIQMGETICQKVNGLVQALTQELLKKSLKGIIEVVPTYRSVTVYFDPFFLSRRSLVHEIESLLEVITPQSLDEGARLIHIPVCYGGVLGPDLELVARYAALTVDKVVDIHTAEPYLVYMLGFTPGFPYLGGLADGLALPRRKVTRTKVPSGSVGIGGNQTGIYPVESPGEWWLIGRTPLPLFMPQGTRPFLLSAGDYVRFVAIDIEEYFSLRKAMVRGDFKPKITTVEKGKA